jgi:hypothetical protein
MHIRHQCRKTTVLSCKRCLIKTGVEKMNNILIWIRTLTTRCLQVRVNGGIQTIIAFLKVRCSIEGYHNFKASCYSLCVFVQRGHIKISFLLQQLNMTSYWSIVRLGTAQLSVSKLMTLIHGQTSVNRTEPGQSFQL